MGWTRRSLCRVSGSIRDWEEGGPSTLPDHGCLRPLSRQPDREPHPWYAPDPRGRRGRPQRRGKPLGNRPVRPHVRGCVRGGGQGAWIGGNALPYGLPAASQQPTHPNPQFRRKCDTQLAATRLRRSSVGVTKPAARGRFVERDEPGSTLSDFRRCGGLEVVGPHVAATTGAIRSVSLAVVRERHRPARASAWSQHSDCGGRRARALGRRGRRSCTALRSSLPLGPSSIGKQGRRDVTTRVTNT